MASSSFRSATVEEYDEGPGDKGDHGGASPHAEGNVDPVTSTDCYPHTCESRELQSSVPVPIQPVGQCPPEAHQHPPPHTYDDDVEPPPPQLPSAPTPPLNPRPKKSKAKASSSSRRRNKDRPEYYGIRGTTTAVAPANPVNPGWTSNSRIARRPTTGWYISGSPPTGAAGPIVGSTTDPPPQIRRLPDSSNRSPQDAPPANAFRNPGATQTRGHQPPSHGQIDRVNGWDTPETHAHGPKTPRAKVGAPHYPPVQQQNPHGIIVLSQGNRSPSIEPSSQANSSGMDARYAQSPPQPQPPQPPAQHNPHSLIVLSSNGNRPSNPSHEGFDQPGFQRMPSTRDEPHNPPQPPPPQNPHGLIVLSSTGSRPTDSSSEAFHQPGFQRMQPANDERRSPPPPNHRPAPQHDGQMAVHQNSGYHNYGRQSAQPVHIPPAQPSTSNGRARDHPSRDPVYITPSPYPDLQPLSLKDAPLDDRRIRQIPPHTRTGQFRSQGMPPHSPSYPDTTSYAPTADTPRQAPAHQREAYPVRNESGHYTPHPQRRHPDDQYPPQEHRLSTGTPAPTVPGDWPESPRQWAPKTPYSQQPAHGYNPSQGASRRPPLSSGQASYSVKTPRYEPSQEVYRPKDNYHEPEEVFESNIHVPSSWPTKHPGDTPTLPEGHPFLRMKDIAIAAILKEFRAWQTSGAPGRRGPHGRRPPFACPFSKKDPLRYKDCFFDTLPTIPDVKEHVSRCHAIPIYCPRCMELFDDERSRDDHIRHADCLSQQLSRPSGVTESQKRQIQSVLTHLPPQDQWTVIFSTVFPRLQPPEYPYVDEALHEDVSTYRDFLETRGPRALSDVLTFRGAATWNLPNEERDLTAFRCLVLEEGIRDLVGQWARRGGGDSLRSPSSLASSSGAGPQRTPSMGSFASSEGQMGRGYAPSSPVEAYHWDPRPRIREEGWDELGDGPAGNGFSDGRGQKMPLYPVSRREQAPYYG